MRPWAHRTTPQVVRRGTPARFAPSAGCRRRAAERRHATSGNLALGGGLAIAAILVGQSWSRHALARGLLLAASVVLLGTLLIFRDFSARALLMLVLPALVFLAALPAFGPMPAPEEDA